MLNIFWPVQISNQELWTRTKQKPIELEIRQRKWGWLGHTLHRPPGDTAKAALEWNPQETRSQGSPDQHGAEQSLKRSDIKAKHRMNSKHSPETVSDGKTLWGPYVPLRNDGKLLLLLLLLLKKGNGCVETNGIYSTAPLIMVPHHSLLHNGHHKSFARCPAARAWSRQGQEKVKLFL